MKRVRMSRLYVVVLQRFFRQEKRQREALLVI